MPHPRQCSRPRWMGLGFAQEFSSLGKSLHVHTYWNFLSSAVILSSHLVVICPLTAEHNLIPVPDFRGETPAPRGAPGGPTSAGAGDERCDRGQRFGAPHSLREAPLRYPAGKRTPPPNGTGAAAGPGAGICPFLPHRSIPVRIPASPLPGGSTLPCPGTCWPQLIPAHGHPTPRPRLLWGWG